MSGYIQGCEARHDLRVVFFEDSLFHVKVNLQNKTHISFIILLNNNNTNKILAEKSLKLLFEKLVPGC